MGSELFDFSLIAYFIKPHHIRFFSRSFFLFFEIPALLIFFASSHYTKLKQTEKWAKKRRIEMNFNLKWNLLLVKRNTII